MTGRSRLTLDLSARMIKTLEKAANRRGCTKAQALRDALYLLDEADAAKEDGWHVGAWGQKGETRVEQIFMMVK